MMSQLGMMAVLAAMCGLVAAGFVWFSGAVVANFGAVRARRTDSEITDDADAEA